MEGILNRKHIRLTPNEKTMVVNAHQWLSGRNPLQQAHQKLGLRKSIGQCLGISERKVDNVLTEWNVNNGVFNEPEIPLGRPRLDPNSLDMVGLETAIREIVLTANRTGVPMSTPRLLHQLEEKGFYLLKPLSLDGSNDLAFGGEKEKVATSSTKPQQTLLSAVAISVGASKT